MAVRKTTDPLDNSLRIVRTMSSEPKRSEIRCPHSYTQHDLVRVQSSRWTIFTCRDCLNDLVYALNRILGNVMKNAQPEIKVSELGGNVGVWCQSCDQRKTGTFYQTNTIELQKEIDQGGKGEYVSQKIRSQEIFCEDCYKSINRPRAILRTKRNIFIPAEVDDKIVKRLWEDGLEETNQIFTLVPTTMLRELMKGLPSDRRENVMHALTGPGAEETLNEALEEG